MNFSDFFGQFLLFILLAFLMGQMLAGIFGLFKRFNDK
jgi:hypothetical protein